MINFRKDLFVKLCKNSSIPIKSNDSIKFDMGKLRYLYMKILDVENTCFNIESTDDFNKERLDRVKKRIKSLKSLIINLEKKAS